MVDIFIDKFKGIRAVNPVVDVVTSGEMSAISSKNVQLKFSENGSNTGIYTMPGNLRIAEIPGKTICGMWESIQVGRRYWFIYAIDATGGYLYHYKVSTKEFELIKDGFSLSELCNGLTVAQGLYDHFVFTNGIDDYVAVNMNAELGTDRVKEFNAVDAEGRIIRGLPLVYYDGRLATACENRVHWSKQGDIFDWSAMDYDSQTNEALLTNAHYEEFDREVKALAYYNNMLIAFTLNYSTYFQGNPANLSEFVRSGATGGGCASFQSVLKFDNKLFYYDHLAKNVFAYYLIDVGQTRPTNGLANDIFDFFDRIDVEKLDHIQVLGFTLEEKNEIWMILPNNEGNTTIILDYLKAEWLERDMQDIRSLAVINGALYSSYDGYVMKEYAGKTFDDQFIPARYEMNIINLGSDSNLKIPKMPIVFTLDSQYSNNFYIEFIYNDQPEKSRIKKVTKTNDKYLIWAFNQDDEKGGYWAEDESDEIGGIWARSDSLNVTFNLSGLLIFKQLQMIIFTKDYGDEFGIKRIEIKRVKIKTKTVG